MEFLLNTIDCYLEKYRKEADRALKKYHSSCEATLGDFRDNIFTELSKDNYALIEKINEFFNFDMPWVYEQPENPSEKKICVFNAIFFSPLKTESIEREMEFFSDKEIGMLNKCLNEFGIYLSQNKAAQDSFFLVCTNKKINLEELKN